MANVGQALKNLRDCLDKKVGELDVAIKQAQKSGDTMASAMNNLVKKNPSLKK